MEGIENFLLDFILFFPHQSFLAPFLIHNMYVQWTDVYKNKIVPSFISQYHLIFTTNQKKSSYGILSKMTTKYLQDSMLNAGDTKMFNSKSLLNFSIAYWILKASHFQNKMV